MLVAITRVHAAERNMDSLLDKKPALNIISLLLMREVGAWTRILNVCLFRKWSIDFVSPEIYTMCSRIELILVSLCALTEIRFIILRIILIECAGCCCEYLIVMARARFVRVFLPFIFAIWNFREEIACVSLGVELSSSFFIYCFILTWTWVRLVWKPSVFDIDCWLEKLPLIF